MTRQVSARLSDSEVRALDSLAKARSISRSALLRAALVSLFDDTTRVASVYSRTERQRIVHRVRSIPASASPAERDRLTRLNEAALIGVCDACFAIAQPMEEGPEAVRAARKVVPSVSTPSTASRRKPSKVSAGTVPSDSVEVIRVIKHAPNCPVHAHVHA
jgi:hypothetical protein